MPGRVIIITGDGKGKTTSAMGQVLRATGQGFNCAVFQFIKGRIPTGEVESLQKLGVPVERLGRGYTWRNESLDRDRELARDGLARAAELIAAGRHQLVVLDEINVVVTKGLLPAGEVARVVAERPPQVSLVLTGRGLAPELAELADTISEVRPIKHALAAGIKATRGIEF